MSWLLVSLCGFLGSLFTGTLSGGCLGMSNREGSIYLSAFLCLGENRRSPRARVLMTVRCFKLLHHRGQKDGRFQFVAGNVTKIGVSDLFFAKRK